MNDQNMDARWQAFFDSWTIRMLTAPWGERLAAFAARGLTDESPRSQRWLRVFVVAVLTIIAIVLMVALELGVLHLAAEEWRSKCGNSPCVRAK